MPNPQKIPQVQQVQVPMPIKGVVRAVARQAPVGEEGHTSLWDAVNVVPYDRYGRKRLAQRGGTLRQYSTQLTDVDDDPASIQGMIEAPNIVYPGQVFGVPFGGLANLPGFLGTFGPGSTIGPIIWNGPTGAFFAPWDWRFQLSVSDTGVTPNDSGGGTVFFYFQAGSTNQDIMIEPFGTWTSDFTGAAVSDTQVNIYKGNHAIQGTWALVTSNQSIGSSTGTANGTYEVIVNPSTSTITLNELTSQSFNNPIHVTGYKFQNIAPELTWMSTVVAPNSSITVTDTLV